MGTILLLLIGITVTYFLDSKRSNVFSPPLIQAKTTGYQLNNIKDNATPTTTLKQTYSNTPFTPSHKIKAMLYMASGSLNEDVINKTLTTLQCARKNNVAHNNILTIIDFSLPSNKKRLWIFDMAQYQLLFHTHVSHGIKSGTLLSQYFSNIKNSKASSLGIYSTENAYRGRHGLSLKLQGLDKRFNDNAYERFIVMHGSWYVNERFIKKYGRPGRSWGCPTLPVHLTKPIIDTIKDRSLLVAYYPGDAWLLKSKFLHCSGLANKFSTSQTKPLVKEKEQRGGILFADLNHNNKREENEPVVTLSADQYAQLFKTKAPLKRMLRRQINGEEYIVLNITELEKLNTNKHTLRDTVYFVIPVVKKMRGYYATEMKVISLGKIKTIKPNMAAPKNNKTSTRYTIHVEGKTPIKLKSTQRFIRWLGL